MLDFKREGVLRMVRTVDMMAKDAEPKRRRITKRDLAKRDLRFIEKLAAGVTIEEIAASEGISLKWARERKAAILSSRVIDTPHEFLKLQIRRMSEAMLVSYGAMSNGDLKAVDKVIRWRVNSTAITASARFPRVSPRLVRSRRRPLPCRSRRRCSPPPQLKTCGIGPQTSRAMLRQENN
jgi:hypothetical protein